MGIAKNKEKGILRISRANGRNVGETSSDIDTFVAQNFSWWLAKVKAKAKVDMQINMGIDWNREGCSWVCVGGHFWEIWKYTLGIWE